MGNHFKSCQLNQNRGTTRIVCFSQDLETSDIEMVPAQEGDLPPAEEHELPARDFKYGICRKHDRALQPTVCKSGKFAGRFVLRCPLFRAYVENGQRMCWTQELYQGDPKELPKGVQKMQRSLKQDLRWNLQHGSSSRATP